jgi:serine phosphatase RsbU (regulator of sigma subunit)
MQRCSLLINKVDLMIKMNLGIKAKLFASFITLCIFSLFFTLVIIWLNDKRTKISNQLKALDEVHLLSMQEYKIQQEFLINKTTNVSFYRTGKSLTLEQQNSIHTKMINRLKMMEQSIESKQLFEPNFINQLAKEQQLYQDIFGNVVIEIKNKGYKDYGLEGTMRNYAHELMKLKQLDQVKILMLRRHEKDFIIRKEVIYISQFKNVIQKLKNEVKASSNLTAEKKVYIDSIVNGYNDAFAKLVSSDWVLNGKIPGSGLVSQLSRMHDVIVDRINTQKKKAVFAEIDLEKNLLLAATVMICLIIVLSFFFSYKLASELSKPISNLNLYIKRFVSSKFTIIPLIQVGKTKDEIAELGENFSKMAEEITSYIQFFEEKVKERTSEINKQHNEIVRQKSKIDTQYTQLMIKTGAMEMQQKLLSEKNKNITDSLRYAERIQKSIMPSKENFKALFSESFVYFEPLEIVSGDFYYVHKKNNKVFFAVADCTGHGVPGAFVSIIGIHALQRALNEFNLEQPAEILNQVNKLVEQDLSNYGNTIINDGMDIAFCCLNYENNTLEYAGANIPLWIISDTAEEELESNLYVKTLVKNSSNETKVLREIKANNQPIGYIQKRIPFTNYTLDVKKGDMIYIFSDGFADQFGGPLGKKFKYKRLKSMLLEINSLTLDKQKIFIKDALKSWQGEHDQVDDICVIGISV